MDNETCGVKGCIAHQDCKLCRNFYLRGLPDCCRECIKGGFCQFVAREVAA